MKIFRIAQTNSDEFLSWFDTSMDDIRARIKHKVIGEPESKSVNLTLYRGFNYLPKIDNGSYLLSPSNSEQGALWFTHSLVSGNIDSLEYAASHGKYLLTYPLTVIKHFQKVSYDNSDDSYDAVPDEIDEKSDRLENCRFYMGYELPEGWFFSYKTEKFIICEKEIEVYPSQIKVVQ